MGRVVNFLWHNTVPEYTLHRSFYIKPSTLGSIRLFCLIYLIAFSVFDWTCYVYGLHNSADYPLFFFTYWGDLITTFYFLMVSICHHVYHDPDDAKEQLFWKLTHIIGETAVAIETTIFVCFWTALFQSVYTDYVGTSTFGLVMVMNFSMHLGTPMCIWIDATFSMLKIYPRHFIFVLLISVLYSIVNLIGVKVIGYQIYQPLITWNDWWTYMVVGIALLISICTYAFWWKIYHFKTYRKPNKIHTVTDRNDIDDSLISDEETGHNQAPRD